MAMRAVPARPKQRHQVETHSHVAKRLSLSSASRRQSSWSGSNASVTSNERSFKLVRERFADEGTVTPARDGAFRCR